MVALRLRILSTNSKGEEKKLEAVLIHEKSIKDVLVWNFSNQFDVHFPLFQLKEIEFGAVG